MKHGAGLVWLATVRYMLVTLVIGGSLSFLMRHELPRGGVRGRVVIAGSETPVPGAEVILDPLAYGPAYRRRRIRTDAHGEFTLLQVTAGAYTLSASSRAHQSEFQRVMVSEGGVLPVTVRVNRSQPDLALRQQQRVFGSHEEVGVAVSGYLEEDRGKTQNVVRLRVYRTRFAHVFQYPGSVEALSRISDTWNPAKRIPAELLRYPEGRAPELARDSRLPIVEGDREGFFYKRIRLGRMPKGLYLLEVQHGKNNVCGWFMVTDLAVVTKRDNRRQVVYAVNMHSGRPVPGCEVRHYRGNSITARAATRADGLVELPVSGYPQQKGVALAIYGDDEAVVSFWYYPENAGGYVTHVYTDRPIYRPGQQIYFKGIVRRKVQNRNGDAGADREERYQVPAQVPITVEVRDPQGEQIFLENRTTSAFGSFHGSVELGPEAPTGAYSLVVNLGSEKHTHDIVVSTYRKPEFDVTVRPEKRRYVRGEEIQCTVDGRYYFGAPVAGATVTYSVYRSPDWYGASSGENTEDSDPDLPDYSEPSLQYGEVVAQGTTILDATGHATLRIRTDGSGREEAVPQENYAISVTVKDGADRLAYADTDVKVVAGDVRLRVIPGTYLTAPGRSVQVAVIATDHDGNPVPGVSVSVETGRYIHEDEQSRYTPVAVRKTNVDETGRAVVDLVFPRSGDWIIKALARDHAGREVRGTATLWAVDDRGEDLSSERLDLFLHTDKKRYVPGETARVLIHASQVGVPILLAVEGEKLYRTDVISPKQRSTIIEVPVRSEYGPNVFLSACYVHRKRFSQSEVPLRVDLPQKTLRVQIHADRDRGQGTGALARYRPGDPIVYRVRTTDASGRGVPCELSISVVDEAIYALREDNPAAIRSTFYPRRYNAVTTRYSFEVEYLGGNSKSEPRVEMRRKFLDTAYWNPTVITDSRGVGEVRFHLPDNLTTWRATVVAHSLSTQVGWATHRILASKDFYVRLVTPRFLTYGDRAQIRAIVHNETTEAQQATVSFSADNLSVTGEARRQVTVAPGQTVESSWSVEAQGVGEAKLRVSTWTTGRTDALTDGVETTIPVRPYGRQIVSAFAGDVADENAVTEVVRYNPSAVPEASRLTIRIAPSLLSVLEGSLDYLVRYPYGCTEQTLSRFLALLLAERILRQIPDRVTPYRADLPRIVRDGLQRLYRLQHSGDGTSSGGGWGWWESDPDDPWMTAYALYGLSVAREQGYPVSQGVLERGRNAAIRMLEALATEGRETKHSASEAVRNVEDRAFLLYALAQSGSGTKVLRMRESIPIQQASAQALAYLILFDLQVGRDYRALYAELQRRTVAESGIRYWRAASDAGFDSDVLVTATVLRALIAVNPASDQIRPVLRWLMLRRTEDHWYSTRDTTWTLAALSDYLRTQPVLSGSGQVTVELGGRLLQTIMPGDTRAAQQEVVIRVPPEQLSPERNEIRIARSGGNMPVFYTITMKQTVASDEGAPARSDKPGVRREYLRVVPGRIGTSGTALLTEPAGNTMQAGDLIRVRLTFTLPRAMSHVIIEDPFPAGCEAMERGSEETVEWSYWWSATDLRDDRIVFFARNMSAGRHVIEYNLRAQTPGVYRVPPTVVQAMYTPNSQFESPAETVTVR
ncbi:MAG: alpha-2-macroglobulin family protein [Chloroherpetonaceae bacterium]|nr:MG2 domain-containing protein [Chthonomonadaceae bacterium]MDW8208294.1 alpha-2-macroglobulin family protein [Chloroherpetonaceae bacterium]